MASFAGSADYTSGSATATFTINKAAPTLSVTDSGGTYSGAEFPATSPSLEGVTPTLTYYAGTTATGTPLSGPPTAAGTYTVVASFAGSADYTSGSATATFTINKAAPRYLAASGGTFSWVRPDSTLPSAAVCRSCMMDAL